MVASCAVRVTGQKAAFYSFIFYNTATTLLAEAIQPFEHMNTLMPISGRQDGTRQGHGPQVRTS